MYGYNNTTRVFLFDLPRLTDLSIILATFIFSARTWRGLEKNLIVFLCKNNKTSRFSHKVSFLNMLNKCDASDAGDKTNKLNNEDLTLIAHNIKI